MVTISGHIVLMNWKVVRIKFKIVLLLAFLFFSQAIKQLFLSFEDKAIADFCIQILLVLTIIFFINVVKAT